MLINGVKKKQTQTNKQTNKHKYKQTESRDWTYIVTKGGPIQTMINKASNLFIISIPISFIGAPTGQLSLTGFFVRDNGDTTSCLHHFWPKVQTKSTVFVVKGYWRCVEGKNKKKKKIEKERKKERKKEVHILIFLFVSFFFLVLFYWKELFRIFLVS